MGEQEIEERRALGLGPTLEAPGIEAVDEQSTASSLGVDTNDWMRHFTDLFDLLECHGARDAGIATAVECLARTVYG